MLLWISAVGLAGAGWFGWLIWRDYDWAAYRWSEVAIPGRSSHSSTTQSGTLAQPGSSSSGNATSDLLGSTQTDWAAGQGSATTSQIADDEPVDDVDATDTEPETTQPNAARPDAAQPDAARRSAADEDYDVDTEDETVAGAPTAAGTSVAPEPEQNAARQDSNDEDFVVVSTSPALAQNGAITTNNEDYVVVDQPGEELDDELPEIDLADYMTQWTPIVPKIAALITHELWPQLRSYLESLPQFGDGNLERVVNAVAEDSAPNTGNANRVGEEASTGFAFYANLFEEMENGSETVDEAVAETDLVMA
jgi:hypothetical protein